MVQYKRVDLSGFSAKQRRALADFQKQLKATVAQRNELAKAARAAYAATVTAPTWNLAEGEYPGEGQPPDLQEQHWNIGAPQVNYVDHIEGIDTDG